MAVFYQSVAHHFPWNIAVPTGQEVPIWTPWSNLAWGVFVAMLVFRGASWFLIEKRGDHAAPAPAQASAVGVA
jgi:hypothetical protein